MAGVNCFAQGHLRKISLDQLVERSRQFFLLWGRGEKAGIILSRDLPRWSAFFMVGTTFPQTSQLFSVAPAVAPAVACSDYQANSENLACLRQGSDDPWTTSRCLPPCPKSIGKEWLPRSHLKQGLARLQQAQRTRAVKRQTCVLAPPRPVLGNPESLREAQLRQKEKCILPSWTGTPGPISLRAEMG